MFERLEEIDWASLSHAYGSAEDVPEMLRNIASDDLEVRDEALYQAYGNIFHQGTRYQASAPVIPFLLELLADPGYTGHDDVLTLIASLVVGYVESFVPFGFLPAVEAMRIRYSYLAERSEAERAEDDKNDGYGTEEEFLSWMLAIVDEARQGVPRYVRLLDSDDEATRLGALRLLSMLPEDFEVFAPALWEVANNDESETVRANALVAISLAATPEAFEEYLADIEALLDGPPLIQLGAALALGPHVPETDEALVAVLIEAIARAPQDELEDEDYEDDSFGEDDEIDEEEIVHFGDVADATITGEEEYPHPDEWHFLWGDYVTHAVAVLGELTRDEPSILIAAVSEAVPRMHSVNITNVTSLALHLLFQDGFDGPDASALTEPQREFLSMLVGVKKAWYYDDSINVDFSLLMTDYGLPGDVGSLTTFLGPRSFFG